MFDPLTIVAIIGTFLMAGTVKGVIGLGLPSVSLALLTVAIDLPHAMGLLLVPSLITNLWQATVGGNGRAILRRLWPFFIMATITVWLGTSILTQVDLSLLSALLGGLLVVYATVSLAGIRLVLSPHRERWWGPLLGAINGILTGMTGSFMVPGVMFLQALELPRNMLIQAMGMLFTASTAALAVALQGNHLLTMEMAMGSSAAFLPAILGMILGQRIREKIPEQQFRRVFFISLLVLGAYIIAHAFDILG